MKLNLESANAPAEATEDLSLVESIEAPEAVAEAPEVEAVEVEEVEAVEEVEEVQEPSPKGPEGNVEGDGHTSPTNTKGAFKAELGEYIEQFGKDEGVEYFMQGLDLAQAQSQYIEGQKQIIKDLKAKIELDAQTEATPLSANGPVDPKGTGLASKISF